MVSYHITSYQIILPGDLEDHALARELHLVRVVVLLQVLDTPLQGPGPGRGEDGHVHETDKHF